MKMSYEWLELSKKTLYRDILKYLTDLLIS